MSEVTTKVHFLIRTAAEAAHQGHAQWMRDLEAVRGVQRVEQVACEYELRATLEAPITAVLLAHRILTNTGASQVRILSMGKHRKRVPWLNLARQVEIIHACKAQMRRFLRIR